MRADRLTSLAGTCRRIRGFVRKMEDRSDTGCRLTAPAKEAPGKLGRGRVFCTLRGKDGKKGTGGDGCTIDSKGNLYITSQIGVQVFDPSGKFLGNIAIPEKPASGVAPS